MDKQSVLDHLSGARAELLAAIEGLSGPEMTDEVVAGTWTIRDILAHLAGWAEWDIRAILAILRGEAVDFTPIEDVDVFNAQLVEERSVLPVDRILAEMEGLEDALLDVINDLPEDDLFDNPLLGGPYWPNLAGWLSVAWEHEAGHAAQIRAWRATQR
jgi:uncharacterized damage-inducible protein DinB